MRVLDLFSGIGGFSLGLERAGIQTVAFCEIEPYCQAVLRRHWPAVPIYQDVRSLTAAQLRTDGIEDPIDLICGGYPCQPFSVAGRRQGEADPRHLWPEMFRLVRELRPRWVVAENVPGHVRLGFDTVADDLEGEGFTVWPFLIPACGVGAPHKRERLWVVAHADRVGLREQPGRGGWAERAEQTQLAVDGSARAVADAASERLSQRDGQRAPTEGQRVSKSERGSRLLCSDVADPDPTGRDGRAGVQWPRGQGEAADGGRRAVEPALRGIPDGLPTGLDEARHLRNPWQDGEWPDTPRVCIGVTNRADRIRALGNAVVPFIPELIGRAILEYDGGR